jgi:hypothetical protein
MLSVLWRQFGVDADVLQPLLLHLSRSIVKDRDLVKTRMKITAYNQN